MISTRINPRVLSPVISDSLRRAVPPGQFQIALKRLSPEEAACLDGHLSDTSILAASRTELAGLAAGAARAGLAELAEALDTALPCFERDEFVLPLPDGQLRIEEGPLAMGIVNVTPDSFSDGGNFFDKDRAIEHALQMAAEGAGILDIGGESTRPGADPVSAEEEIKRVIPIIRAVARQTCVPVSVDTCKAPVARQALDAGAMIVNDISGLRADKDMAPLAARTGAAVVVMHIQGTPRSMQKNPRYTDLMDEIAASLRDSLRIAHEAGVSPDRTIVDPGIGFGKTIAHNLEILDRLGELRTLGRPVLVGTSRKSTIGKILDAPLGRRAFGTAATVAVAVRNGAKIVRVHDVAEMLDVARMTHSIGRWQSSEYAPEAQ